MRCTVVKSWQPCVSNPAVARVMAQGVTEYSDANPDAIAVNFAVNDGRPPHSPAPPDARPVSGAAR